MIADRITLAILLSLLAIVLTGATMVVRRSGRAPNIGGAPTSRIWSAARILMTAVWFGFAAGWVQVLLALINRFGRGRILAVGPQFVWMFPLGSAATFAIFAMLPAVLSLVSPRLVPWRAAVLMFGSLAAFSLLLPFTQVHMLASLLLSLGIGLQLARLLVEQQGKTVRLMTWCITASVLLVAVVAVVSPRLREQTEKASIARLPSAPPNAPNVLLIVLDTVRASSLSLYGYNRPTTSELDRWARESVTFDRAFSTAPWTLKSHASMFTGLYPGDMAGDFEFAVRTEMPTLAERFSRRGYATAGIVANLFYTARDSGLAKGFVHYDDHRATGKQILKHTSFAMTPLAHTLAYSSSLGERLRALVQPNLSIQAEDFTLRTYGRRPATDVTSAFLEWQADTSGRPFFAFLNYFDAHEYRPSPLFVRRFARPGEGRDLGMYEGAIATIDHELGRLSTNSGDAVCWTRLSWS